MQPWNTSSWTGVHEFLVGLPFERPTATLDYRVTYQDSCHLANAQGVTAPPRDLLRSIPGVELVELPGAEICCGAGGTYTITERDFSLRLLDSKMEAVERTAVDIVATANPGCLLQLQYGASKRGHIRGGSDAAPHEQGRGRLTGMRQ